MASYGSTSNGHGSSRDGSSTFEYHSCIQSYHEYKSIWDASIKAIICNHETDNDYNDYAVSVVHRGVIVGHVPHHLWRGFSLFLNDGSISIKQCLV